MKRFFRAISGIGFVAVLIGGGAMSSPSLIVPIAIIFIGIGLYAFGTYMEEQYA